MKTTMCYIAQPIDFGSGAEDLALNAMGQMAAMGWVTYDPRSAFTVGDGATPAAQISAINTAAMNAAQGAVAFLPRGVQSVGVPAEIGYFQARNTPVLLVTDHTSSWVVAGWDDDPNIEVVEMTVEGLTSGLDWLRDRVDIFRMLSETSSDAPVTYEVEPITFQKLVDSATLPTKGYADDAGYDLYASRTASIPARGQAMVPLGVSVDIPEGMWAEIRGRSSTLRKFSLMVAPTVGVIDEGYTGELWAPVVSLNDREVVINEGQRIAQLILHHAPGQVFQPVWGTVRDKARGSNGFGSTGL